MNTASHPLSPPDVSTALVRAELARVLASEAFQSAFNAQRLLSYLAEHTLAGDTARLKETVLALEVFLRSVSRFDPVKDSIVRVEARRLRQRLARHYAGSGADSPLRFELPSGRYALKVVAASGLALPPVSAEEDATELARRGDFFARLGHEEGLRKALHCYAQSLGLQPAHVGAHLGTARAWVELVELSSEAVAAGVAQAQAAAHRVLAHDPRHAEALVLLADLQQRFEHDWPAARALFEQAVQAAPRSAAARLAFMAGLLHARRFDEAAAQLQQARSLQPFDADIPVHQALLHFHRREWLEAERHLRGVLDGRSRGLRPLALQARLHQARGDARGALAAWREVQASYPQLSLGAVGMAQAMALSGRESEARIALERLARQAGPRATPYQLALVHAALGEKEAALARLEAAAVERDPHFFALGVDPAFDTLRAEPRFGALARRLG